jgi:predicted membrane GTPase involved in stress response
VSPAYPLSVLITDPSAPSQRWFAQESLRDTPSSPGAALEAHDGGLLCRGTTELDLELICHAVLKRFPSAKVGRPRVEYVEGPPLQEPYYRITVQTPEDRLGDVISDLTARRGTIALLQDSSTGKAVHAEVPVGECFGYSTSLRNLTRGAGQYTVDFIGYRPFSGPGTGAPVDAA